MYLHCFAVNKSLNLCITLNLKQSYEKVNNTSATLLKKSKLTLLRIYIYLMPSLILEFDLDLQHITSSNCPVRVITPHLLFSVVYSVLLFAF